MYVTITCDIYWFDYHCIPTPQWQENLNIFFTRTEDALNGILQDGNGANTAVYIARLFTRGFLLSL